MRNEKNEDDSENRKCVYDYIKKNPDAHLRMITRELGMGTTQHHLDILERFGKVKSRRINIYRQYYAVEVLEAEHDILAFLRQETAMGILTYLMEHPRSTQSDIINFKGFSAPTISWHMARLEEAGLVSSIKEGRTIRYTITNMHRIIAALKTCHHNVCDKMLSRFADLFLQISSETKNEESG
ncbi:MAG: winged helix-turn-helix transcriptional regulator [Nitrosotalea sp.]